MTYVLNIITEKKMDGQGNVLHNGRVLNKYPLCTVWSGTIESHTRFLEAIYNEYLQDLDEDTLDRTFFYLRSHSTGSWESSKIPVVDYIKLIKQDSHD